jgi:archaemetzincin
VADRLYLVPVGEVPGDILTTLCAELEEALGITCAVAPALPHPSDAYNSGRDQYLSPHILGQLGQLDLPGAIRFLGVVNLDLYVPELNFIFGQATLGGGEALVALPRLHQSFYGLAEDSDLFHRRLLKETIHELGHTFGLGHCPQRTCVMCFSNSLRDTDIKGQSFCPGCRSRLEDHDWTIPA